VLASSHALTAASSATANSKFPFLEMQINFFIVGKSSAEKTFKKDSYSQMQFAFH